MALGGLAGGADALMAIIQQKLEERQMAMRERALAESMKPKAPEPHKPMEVGGRIVDPNTGKVIYEAPPEPTKPRAPISVAGGARLYDPDSNKVLLDALQEPEKPAAPQRPITVAPGGRVIDPTTGKLIFSAPDRPQTGGSDTGGQYTSVQQVIGPDGKPAMVNVDRRNNRATPIQMPAGFEPNRPARPVTGAERQTLAYYLRMEQALKDIEALEPEISKQGLLGQAQGQLAPNILQTGTQQKYRQAQRAFTEGRLRKESGAAIPQQEYDNDAKTYFFQPGDKDVTQKQAGRRQVLEGLKMSSGRAYQEHFGDDGDKGGAAAGGGGGKSVSLAQIQAIAKKRGTSVEQERQRAAAEGYVVR